MSKTVADYLGPMCPGPLPRSILEQYAQIPECNGLVFCDRCWNMAPLSRDAADMFVGFGKEAYGSGFHFNPQTHYFITSCCPNCADENAGAQVHYAKARDYPQQIISNTGDEQEVNRRHTDRCV